MRTTLRHSFIATASAAGLVTALAVPAGIAVAAEAGPGSGAVAAATADDGEGNASPSPTPANPADQAQDRTLDNGASEQDQPNPTPTVDPAEQDTTLSNGAVAHVHTLPGGNYMAWITLKGSRIANLSADQPTATVNGFRYQLNQANGFVGVRHPDGWHSEQDQPNPTPTVDPAEQDTTLSNGAVAHVHTLPGGNY
ncbi:hypothetical protein AB0M49_36715, partial [Streptomyces sp. NPDC051577]